MTFSIGQVLSLHSGKCYVIGMDHFRCYFRWLRMVLPCCALCMVIKISFAGIKSSNPQQGNRLHSVYEKKESFPPSM